MVAHLNRMLTDWENYYCLEEVFQAYAAVDEHTTRWFSQWLCRKHKVKCRKFVRFPNEQLYCRYGLNHLPFTTKNFPWAKA